MATTADIIKIIKLTEDLAPSAVALVKALMEDLAGKPDEAILAEADAAFDRVISKAKES